uniref:Uncharacterized protein n=1 Tax=Meloidogyne incognita TaxID=6306 RepID=A0A914LQY4_MELIC
MALVPEEVPTTSADEATKEFFGYLVEVDCGEEGSYSGLVTQVEPADNNLGTWGKMKLETPFRNGVPLGEQVAIFVPGELIVNIKVLNMPSSQQPQPFVFTPTKQPQSAPQTPRPAISLQQTTQQPQRTSNQLQQPVKFQHQLPHRVLQPYPKFQHQLPERALQPYPKFQHQLPERALQQQQQKFPHQQQPKFLHQTRFFPLQSPKFSLQHPRFSLQQQQSPKLPLQQQLPQHSIQQQQQRFPLNPFSYPFVDKNQVIRPNTATPQGFHRIFKNRKQGLQITEPPPQNNNNNKTTKFVPRSVEINNKKEEKLAAPKTVVKQNSNKRTEKSVPKAEQKKRTESTTSSNQQIQKTVENIVKDEKIREQVDRNAALFAKLKVDDQSTNEGRQQQFESLKKIEEQQKQKAQNRKKIGDKLKKQIEDHIKKTEKEAAEKKEIKKEEENQKDSKKDEENKKNVEEKKFGGKQQNSFEIQSSSKTPNDGDLASIRCPDGIYQGVVKEVNAEDQTIRLENPLLYYKLGWTKLGRGLINGSFVFKRGIMGSGFLVGGQKVGRKSVSKFRFLPFFLLFDFDFLIFWFEIAMIEILICAF